MKKYDVIIGIDPDTKLSGYAKIETKTGIVQSVGNWELSKLFGIIASDFKLAQFTDTKILVVVEAAYLASHHNWHLGNGFISKNKAAAIGYDTGRNHETGRAIIEFCRYLGIDVKAQIPLRKCWRGADKKITHDEITKITKWDKKRSNPEIRDALLIAWVNANLPIKL